MAVISTGLSVTYQSGFLAEIVDFGWSGISRESIPTSNMASSGAMTFLPAKLYDPGELRVELLFDPEQSPVTPITAAAETVTVTYADAAPASTMAASGFMTNFEIAGPLEDRMTATATLKLSDAITHG